MSDARYPIGPWQKEGALHPERRNELIAQIGALPANLSAAVRAWSEEKLDTPYREGGWTVRQLIHHLADSHINSYVRFRLALTEDAPPVKTYKEADWAKLPDASTAPVEISLRLLEALHKRWVLLLESLEEAQFRRTITHPEHGQIDLDYLVSMYAWHCRHHVAHIEKLSERMGW